MPEASELAVRAMGMQLDARDHGAVESELSGDDIDDAIEAATARTTEAERSLVAEPLDSPKLPEKAERVVNRAEDLDELTGDAAGQGVDPEP
jgi:hypothetical protein